MPAFFELDQITKRHQRHTIGGSRHSRLMNHPFKVVRGQQSRPESRAVFTEQDSPRTEEEEDNAGDLLLLDQMKIQLTTQRQSTAKQGLKDLGNISFDHQNELTKLKNFVTQDVNPTDQWRTKHQENYWETVKVENGVQIEALNPTSNKIDFSKVTLLISIMVYLIAYSCFNKFKELTGWQLGYFWLGLAIQLINFKRVGSLLSFRSRYTLLRARTVIKGDAIDIGREFMKSYADFDIMTPESKELSRHDSDHTIVTCDVIDLPSDSFVKQLVPVRKRRIQTYWGIDDQGIFYVQR